MEIGEKITFGKYLWRILDIKPGKLLIITDEIIEQRNYHAQKTDIDWEHSSIRNYLNNDFLSQFSSVEQSKIISVVNKNRANNWYHTHAGNDTLDHIFLLSLEEVTKYYFGDSSVLLDNPKPKQRYWFERKDVNNHLRRATYLNYIWWWWTRTPGKNQRVSVYIHGDGNIGIQGNGICNPSFNTLHPITKSNKGGLRPALWLKI
ncbi:MAG TPA: DUF6273 domain-containing protein [Bacilli bacterium]|nr:DUF6273 domain-containing protein [Bacilli bacterium]